MLSSTLVIIIGLMFVVILILMALLAALFWISFERQLKELAKIRRKIESWAEEDLEIKQFNVPSQEKASDAIQWLDTCASRAMGVESRIVRFPVEFTYGEPKVLAAENSEGRLFFLSNYSPEVIRRIPAPSRWPWFSLRPSHLGAERHPLIPLRGNVEIYKLSTLNCGIDFEMEAAQIWQRMTGEAP